jgi:hypothetical protein
MRPDLCGYVFAGERRMTTKGQTMTDALQSDLLILRQLVAEHAGNDGFAAYERVYEALAHRTTPADPRPDPRDEALREAREAITGLRSVLVGEPMPNCSSLNRLFSANAKADQALAKINAVMAGGEG